MMSDLDASRLSLEILPGDHACCLYSTEDEHRRVFTELIRRGLERGEKVWYAFDTHDCDTILSYLRDDGLDPEPYLHSGQLVLTRSAEVYVPDGHFDAERNFATFAEAERVALAAGYTGLCVTGETQWASDNHGHLDTLSKYECAANAFALHPKAYFVCQFDTRRFPPQHLLEEIANHPLVIAGVELCRNFLYVAPQDLVAGDRPTTTLQRWLDNLVSHRDTDKTLRDGHSFREAVLNSTNTLIMVLDREGRIVELNETCARTSGHSREDARGEHIWDVFPTPDKRSEGQAHFAAVLAGRFGRHWQRPLVTRAGAARMIDWSDTLLRDDAGEVEYVVVTGIDVTEQRRAEVALRENELRLVNLLDSATEALAVMDLQGRILDVNKVTCDLMDYTRKELRGQHCAMLFTPEDAATLPHEFAIAIERGTYTIEKTVLTRSGQTVPFEIAARLIEYKGQPAILGSGRNITDRRRADAQRNAMIAGLQAIVEGTDELIGAPDLDTLFRRAVEFARERLSLERCAIFAVEGDSLRGTFGTDFQGRTTDERAAAFATDEAFWELFETLRSGGKRWLVYQGPLSEWNGEKGVARATGENAATPIRLRTGAAPLALLFNDNARTGRPLDEATQEVVAVFCSLLAEIIEQQRAEDLLRIERDLGLALDTATDIPAALECGLEAAVAIAGMDCGAVYSVNQPEGNVELVMHVGLSPTFVARASHYPADAPNARVILAGEPVYFGAENPCPLADMQEEGLSALAVIPIKHDGHAIACLHAASHTARSVSETARHALRATAAHFGGAIARFEAEAALRQDRADLQTLFDTMDDMVFVFDSDGHILQVNDAACKRLGYTRDEFAALSVADLHAPEDRAQAASALTDFLAGDADRCELPRLTKNGAQIPVETRVTLGRWGGHSALVCITRDMTERKQAEQMQRLTAVGQLAAGVAHEFNNLLAAMMMGAEVAAQQRDEGSYRRLAEVVMRSTERGADICRNLIAFARPREPKRVRVTIEQPIESALKVAARQLQNADVRVERSYDTAGHSVSADAGQLEQVFLNLFINASHAMTSGGTLRVETHHIPSATGPGQVQVKVSDTGLGIAPECLPRVFEPFFTTKGRLGGSDTPGTGLGLSVSHGIVQAHKGRITVHSTVGIGTTFELCFAASEPDVPVAAPPQPQERESAAPATGIAARILVVDDEPDVRAVVMDCLSGNGYEIVGVGSTHEALALVGTGGFDLIISDLLMPGGGGKAILEFVRDLTAPPPVLIMTGRVEDHLTEEMLASGAAACLGKPFRVAELREMVARLIGRHSEEAAQGG